MQIKRPHYLYILLQDGEFIDVKSLLRGKVRYRRRDHALAFTALTQRERRIGPVEFAVLHGTPAQRWLSADQVGEQAGAGEDLILELAKEGFLLCNREEEHFLELRRRNRSLLENGWHPCSAFFHFMTRRPDAIDRLSFKTIAELEQRAADSPQAFDRLIAERGAPPHHFHQTPKFVSTTRLPVPDRRDNFFKLLRARKTHRRFRTEPLTPEQLNSVLYYVFGCQGFSYLADSRRLVALKKTSPSAGSLHPTEAYPLVLRVDGIQSGLYHYDVANHGLDLLRPMALSEAEDFANVAARGQIFIRDAAAVFILTSRFYRNFWKYRALPWAYGALLMDAGHLSQTFYLVCTKLGLGAFFTAAVDRPAIESEIGLNGFEQGPIGLCGCGRPLSPDASLSLRPEQFEPGQSI